MESKGAVASSVASYFTRPLLTILALGFASGLPLALTVGTLSFWLADAKVDKASIGLFAIIGLPYTLKFLWSPMMDSIRLPLLTARFGHRRGWMLLTQACLMLAIACMALTAPELNPLLTAAAALGVTFLSASQDIVIDAYRVESIGAHEQGQGAAMIQLGYRLGMITSGAGALYLADRMGWHSTYLIMACLMGLGLVVTLLAQEPEIARNRRQVAGGFKSWFRDAVVAPFAEFMQRDHWWLILLFIMLFALADAFIGRMTNPFFHDIGFTKTQVAEVVKVYGMGATILGTFIGGAFVKRYGAVRVLFVAALLHALTNLLFVVQTQLGANVSFLAVSTVIENLSGGISAAAFVAYLSALCNLHYTATQYALLSSLAALSRTLMAAGGGYVEQALGWSGFFIFATCLAVPGLLVLWVLSTRLTASRPQAAAT